MTAILRTSLLEIVQKGVSPRHDQAAEAIAALRPAVPYDLRIFDALYVRGLAYLAARDGAGAAGEFQKILNNQGIDSVSPLYPLSRLGLARADALRKDFPAARREYETFLASWKDADPDLPILRDAKNEYGGDHRRPGAVATA